MMSSTRRSIDFWDSVARRVISAGGLVVILAVLVIIIFIAREGIPLFWRATISPKPESPPIAHTPLTVSSDEYRESIITLDNDGVVRIRREGALTHELAIESLAGKTLTAGAQNLDGSLLAAGTASGRVVPLRMNYQRRWLADGARALDPKVSELPSLEFGDTDGAIRKLNLVVADEEHVKSAIVTHGGNLKYGVYDPDAEEFTVFDLSDAVAKTVVTALALSGNGERLIAGSQDGRLYYWRTQETDEPEFIGAYTASQTSITSLVFLIGSESLIVGDASGALSLWFPVRVLKVENTGEQSVDFDGEPLAPGASRVVPDLGYADQYSHLPELSITTHGLPLKLIRTFDPHAGAIVALAASPRDKGFVSADSRGGIRLHYATTAKTMLRLRGGASTARTLTFTPKADGFMALDEDFRLHRWWIDNPHPQATVASLFTKVWYEGYSQPMHVWQSTGGSDDFEPKLGLWPLLFGTLKATFFAMIFSIPLAIFTALYLSQLAAPALRNTFKPIIEIMAALPSVVVGFLAALWLAPLIERSLSMALVWLLSLPLCVAAGIGAWYLIPLSLRERAKPGTDLALISVFVLFSFVVAAYLGKPLEIALFGGDLRAWLFESFGMTYDQRNSIIVGIALGFAVIPIIFSISEDAMTNVPPAFTSASLALGASKWQTAVYVVLPAASPGIFAAILLGLGRAVGETMIVLMATGNTPVLDLSPFNGMRTMSASIAVEIPEAPYGGTLYRVLFLTGFLLFCFTFFINTFADVIGHRLRRRYARF